MSWETVATRTKEILERVDWVYNVHKFFRDIKNETEFQDAFSVDVDGKTLLTGWMITRKSIDVKRPHLDANATLDCAYKIDIQGIMGMSDAEQSELLFQKAIDGILLKLKGKYLLEDETNGVALSGIVKTSELQVEEIGHGQFSNLFVHFCRMSLLVTERI